MTQYGYDGQVGCAAITLHRVRTNVPVEEGVLRDMEQHLASKGGLPSYAVPRFVRILKDSEDAKGRDNEKSDAEHVNQIFKKIKMNLRQEGFTPQPESKDRMYWLPREGEGFVDLDREMQQRLLGGKARF